MRARRLTLLTLLALVPTLLLAAAPLSAAEFDVDRTDDPLQSLTAGCTPAPNDCTLRLALQLADADIAPDLVVLPAGTFRRFAGGGITVRQSVTIVGAGARRTIIEGSSPGGVLAFAVQSALESPKAAGLRDLTITGGDLPFGAQGAGIDVQGAWDLSLDRVEVTGNSERSDGVPWATGAGIRFDGGSRTLRISDSVIAGNLAVAKRGKSRARGAGLYVASGRAELTDTTVTGNVADGDGSEAAEGGGIAVATGASLLLDHVTLAGDIARNTSASAAVGNLWAENGSTVEVRDSLIAGGLAPPGGENCVAPVTTTDGGNIEDRDQCGLGAADRRNADARLAPLADNGGPVDTMALLPGSAALDVRPAPCPGADARGVLRPQGPGCDAGAFELAPPTAGGSGPAPGAGAAGGGGAAPGAGAGSARRRVLKGVGVRLSAVRTGRATDVSRFVVRGPVGARVRVTCAGPACTRRAVTGAIGPGGALRVRAMERVLAAGTVLVVRVTAAGAIGRFVALRLRAAGPPVRRSACLRTPSGPPSACPRA